jgi:hypothetical protein
MERWMIVWIRCGSQQRLVPFLVQMPAPGKKLFGGIIVMGVFATVLVFTPGTLKVDSPHNGREGLVIDGRREMKDGVLG